MRGSKVIFQIHSVRWVQWYIASFREIETGLPQGSILESPLFIIYMNDIHTASDNLNFILYVDYTILSNPICSFTTKCNNDIKLIRILINLKLNKDADWVAISKHSRNVPKICYFIVAKGL